MRCMCVRRGMGCVQGHEVCLWVRIACDVRIHDFTVSEISDDKLMWMGVCVYISLSRARLFVSLPLSPSVSLSISIFRSLHFFLTFRSLFLSYLSFPLSFYRYSLSPTLSFSLFPSLSSYYFIVYDSTPIITIVL